MAPIKTYVFFDLEATGLMEGTDIPAITELGMLAVKRNHLLGSCLTDELIVDKFLMSFKPHKPLSQVSVQLSGLSNELLEDAAEFNNEAFNAINSFINCLQKPVCLIAHNGFKYHFKVVKNHFRRMGNNLAADVMCGDSLDAFYHLIEEEKRRMQELEEANGPVVFAEPANENNSNSDSADSYKLNEIYRREIGADLVNNRAENQCTMMLQIAQKRALAFCKWVEENCCPFSQVPTE